MTQYIRCAFFYRENRNNRTDPDSLERRQCFVADVLHNVIQRLGKQHGSSVESVFDRFEQLHQSTQKQH